jgi:hypothetical protein
MEMRDGNSGITIQQIVGAAVTGDSIIADVIPSSVRKFNIENIQGVVVTGWTYNDGIVTLPDVLGENEYAVAYAAGIPFWSEMYLVRNLADERTKQNSIIINSEHKLKDVGIDIVNEEFTDDVLEWYNGSSWVSFPAEIPWINKNVDYDFLMRITADEETPVTNARDIYIKISALEVGDE